jgi:hypothetical protein
MKPLAEIPTGNVLDKQSSAVTIVWENDQNNIVPHTIQFAMQFSDLVP